MGKLKWTDSEQVAIALAEEHPEQDPLKVRFTDLHHMVMELIDFDDPASASNEAKLEAIQMAWYEEWKEIHEE